MDLRSFFLGQMLDKGRGKRILNFKNLTGRGSASNGRRSKLKSESESVSDYLYFHIVKTKVYLKASASSLTVLDILSQGTFDGMGNRKNMVRNRKNMVREILRLQRECAALKRQTPERKLREVQDYWHQVKHGLQAKRKEWEEQQNVEWKKVKKERLAKREEAHQAGWSKGGKWYEEYRAEWEKTLRSVFYLFSNVVLTAFQCFKVASH